MTIGSSDLISTPTPSRDTRTTSTLEEATLDSLLALIPDGTPGATQLRNIITQISTDFSSELGEITPERVQGWVDELAGGEGRSIDELRSDIYNVVVGLPLIQRVFGVDADTASSLISGETTFSSLTPAPANRDPLFNPGISAGGGAPTVPAGSTLYRVFDPASGAVTYHLVGEWMGVNFSYEIGDQARLDELGIERAFDATIRVNLRQFEGLNALSLGNVDEVLDNPEPLGRQWQEEMRLFGEEALPDWIRNSPEMMFIYMQGANEGWTAGRTIREASTRDAFQERFPAWARALEEAGGNEEAAMSWYTQRENTLSSLIRRYRGSEADTSASYIGELLNIGWEPEVIGTFLAAERQLVTNPSALDDLNAVLRSEGLNPIGRTGMVAMIAAGTLPEDQAEEFLAGFDITRLLEGNTPEMVFDMVNDALMSDALVNVGLTGFDLDFVRELRNETGGVLDEAGLQSFAQTAAANILRLGVDVGRYGLNEEDVVSQLAGRSSPTGRTAAENASLFSKILREREANARGVGSPNTFFTREGRVILQGIGSL